MQVLIKVYLTCLQPDRLLAGSGAHSTIKFTERRAGSPWLTTWGGTAIGKNVDWKHEINLGKQSNQNFKKYPENY
jgi:hypothetical protein